MKILLILLFLSSPVWAVELNEKCYKTCIDSTEKDINGLPTNSMIAQCSLFCMIEPPKENPVETYTTIIELECPDECYKSFDAELNDKVCTCLIQPEIPEKIECPKLCLWDTTPKDPKLARMARRSCIIQCLKINELLDYLKEIQE